jgi:hypothetical protein
MSDTPGVVLPVGTVVAEPIAHRSGGEDRCRGHGKPSVVATADGNVRVVRLDNFGPAHRWHLTERQLDGKKIPVRK